MKYTTITILIMLMGILTGLNAQKLDFSKVKAVEHQLADVMELTDTTVVKFKLQEVEKQFKLDSTNVNKVRLGIIYHETALNLSFLSQSEYDGYAKRSYDVFSELLGSPEVSSGLLPFIASYRASALSLVSAKTRNLKLLSKAFEQFDIANESYAAISYLPEFLRGSVAENLPWYFFSKKKAAQNDFISIIRKYDANKNYANDKIMSFTYWAWANQHQNKRNRKRALSYLEKSIKLDPNYKGGRMKAEELKRKFNNKE